jgi:hypothetical protein
MDRAQTGHYHHMSAEGQLDFGADGRPTESYSNFGLVSSADSIVAIGTVSAGVVFGGCKAHKITPKKSG